MEIILIKNAKIWKMLWGRERYWKDDVSLVVMATVEKGNNNQPNVAVMLAGKLNSN